MGRAEKTRSCPKIPMAAIEDSIHPHWVNSSVRFCFVLTTRDWIKPFIQITRSSNMQIKKNPSAIDENI